MRFLVTRRENWGPLSQRLNPKETIKRTRNGSVFLFKPIFVLSCFPSEIVNLEGQASREEVYSLNQEGFDGVYQINYLSGQTTPLLWTASWTSVLSCWNDHRKLATPPCYLRSNSPVVSIRYPPGIENVGRQIPKETDWRDRSRGRCLSENGCEGRYVWVICKPHVKPQALSSVMVSPSL